MVIGGDVLTILHNNHVWVPNGQYFVRTPKNRFYTPGSSTLELDVRLDEFIFFDEITGSNIMMSTMKPK